MLQGLLAPAFGVGRNELGSHSFFTGFGSDDLRCGFVNAGEGSGDPGVLQLALATVVFDRSAGSRDCRAGLVNLRPEIVILQFDDQVTVVHLLLVFDVNRKHDAGHFSAQRNTIVANVSIMGDRFDPASPHAFPLRMMVIQTARASNTARMGLTLLSPFAAPVMNGRRHSGRRLLRF